MASEEEISQYSSEFCEVHGITLSRMLPPFSIVLTAALRSHAALADALRNSTPERATWGMLWRMSKRASEHAGATMALWATGFPAQAEVESRAVFEHSATLLYLTG